MPKVSRCINSLAQKYEATKSVLNAPQDSVLVKMVPHLIGCESSIREAGNKVITMTQDFLNPLPEASGAHPKSNNYNPCNDTDNNNPTNTKKQEDNWDHCENLVAEHNANKQDQEYIRDTFGYHEMPTPDYYYDASTSNNYVLQPIEDTWTYVE